MYKRLLQTGVGMCAHRERCSVWQCFLYCFMPGYKHIILAGVSYESQAQRDTEV